MLTSGLEHYRRQQRISVAGLQAARRARGRGALVVAQVVTAYQLVAARDAAEAVPQMLDEQGIDAPAEGEVAYGSVSGRASDGRRLDTLFEQAQTESQFDMMVATQLQDAARIAAGIAIVSRPKVTGYVRMLNPPSCSRCAILAGKFFKWNKGFERHPRCFPAGVAVSGPRSEAATRRWFEGELIVLTTASGQELPLTGNHPVLTSRGWVPANIIQEGDEVVRSTRPKGAAALVVPDHDQMPALVEDVWRSFGVNGLDRVPSAAEDFHGDGQGGEVDVVYADRSLRRGDDASLEEHLRQDSLSGGVVPSSLLDLERVSELVDLGRPAHPGGAVRGSDLPLALDVAQLLVPNLAGLTHVPALNSGVSQDAGNGSAGDSVLTGEAVLASPGLIGGNDRVAGNDDAGTRWDAPTLADAAEQRRGYATVGLDLLDRLSGQVELDRVVFRRSVEFRGHVYSLTSSEGWHVANSLIVSNCDCRHIPSSEALAGDLTTDPQAYFDSLSEAEQNRIFTNKGAEAIRDGANPTTVVNARRNMASAHDDYLVARGGKVRGGSGAGPAPAEGPDLLGFMREANAGVATSRGVMSPEGIYRVAGDDRARAIEMLRANGYIT